MGQGDIWVAAEDDDVKHILSVMDIKKMIPIVDGVYSRVNINPDDTDTDEVKKYKDLLNSGISSFTVEPVTELESIIKSMEMVQNGMEDLAGILKEK